MVVGGQHQLLALRPGHGQDEKSPVLAEIVDPFDDPALALWMKRFNPGRI